MSPTSLFHFEMILDLFAGKRVLTVVMGVLTVVTTKNIAVGA